MRKSNQQELVLQHNTGIPASIIKPVPTAFVSTYPPRRCGIATFTHDLISSIAQITGTSLGDSPDLQVIAMNNIPEGYEYPHQVRFEIRDQHKQDYREAADFINVSAVEIVSLQHEYGIFGGDSGAYILTFLRNLHKPVVTTLHTVLQKPNPVQKKILTEICELSTRVVVLSEKARELLHEVYGVPLGKIDFIHHGVPDVPFLDPAFYKDQFDLEGRLVMLTFGLINPNKGIEYAIDALAQIVDKHPEVAYIVLGATHPEVKRHFGEEYRLFLNRKVKEKGLEDHVFFHNRFVTHDELIKFLILADVYLTPYLSKEQIASGTLAYAIGCGKAVISTPYWYAEEMLADDRGRLVPFKDAEALAAVLDEILSDEITRNRLRKNAYTFGRNMIWRQVAIQYLQTFQASMEQYARVRPRPLIQPRPKDIPQPSLPEINLSHMKLLTDDTGILQHAKFTTPDRFHGYTTDDNARALLVTALHWDLFSDETILPLMHRYLSFLHYAFHEKHGRFRNFMSFDRKWLEEIGSEDCQGRALWALGTVIQFAPTPGILRMATYLFEKALPAVEKFKSLRGHAAAILGCTAYLQRFSGASEIRRHLEESTEFLLKKFRANHSDTWIWWEDVLTYDNARLPQALIVAGHILKDQEALETGLRTLKWLLQIQTNPATGYLSLIGNDGWAHKNGDRAHFDQQPLDAGALVEACYDAYLITDEPGWYDELTKCFHWFFGENDIQEPVYDFTTGGCRDGLQKTGVNENQGAESTLAWLIALHKMHALSIEKSLERTKTPLPVDEEAEVENEA